MTLQQPTPTSDKYLSVSKRAPILCHKCGAEISFSKDHVGPSGRKIPLQPNTNGEPHVKYCMYANLKENPHTEALFIGFLSKVPNRRQKRIIGAVGRAK
jgi:hypothetical protein